MKLFKLAKTFRNDEDGAVTVDWVVITAGIVLLASLVGNGIHDETVDLGERVGTQVAEMKAKDWE